MVFCTDFIFSEFTKKILPVSLYSLVPDIVKNVSLSESIIPFYKAGQLLKLNELQFHSQNSVILCRKEELCSLKVLRYFLCISANKGFIQFMRASEVQLEGKK